MSLSLTLACIWAVVATGIAVAPGRFHWPGAWVLIGCGVPLLGWVTLENGPWVGLIVLLAGVSVLRWPVFFLVRKLRSGRGEPAE
ncbi:DUF2484 family protein [Phaeovulum sp.]|uniref:DUF2484 family protein n=1 Tax=Phaeovulum sp. TaxID=2934796 RepID=UPI0039E4704D